MKHLNTEQRLAATSYTGHILVLAGAGSGKTSVLVERCIYLVKQKNVSPSSLLALTFTNKAAKEMKKRVAKKLGDQANDITMTTFHSFCYTILQQEIHHLGFTHAFTIYQEREIKRLLESLAPYVLENMENVNREELYFRAKNPKTKEDFALKQALTDTMQAHNVLDFDSLLEMTIKLFEEFPEVLAKYQQGYQFVMIDEYQDTNYVQYTLAKQLTAHHGNLFVVGDDDQSIYSFRGSDVRLILDFPYREKITLEQNYRSTTPILNVANHVIKKNPHRHQKTLVSTKNTANLPHLFFAPDETLEAKAVIMRILELREQKGLSWSDFAILYRSNTLSKLFEVELMSAHYKRGDTFLRGIPYEIVGGTEFYERAEVKDFFAYLRMIANEYDETAILRIINYPRRGISPDSVKKITSVQRAEGKKLIHTLHHLPDNISSSARAGVKQLLSLLAEAKKIFQIKTLPEAIQWLLHQLEFEDCLKKENKDPRTFAFKWGNLQTILEMAQAETSLSLQDFLNSSMLDQIQKHNAQTPKDRLHLLTFHSAKGLEFSAVFLTCLEDELLPHEKSRMEGGLEEERRLFYVAITRAKEYLTLSMAQTRKKHGKAKPTNPSRFLFDIPKECLIIEPYDFPKKFI